MLLITPSMTTRRTTTFVKGSHRFISGSGLDLHEKCFFVIAFWTLCFSCIHILPRSCPSQYIINFFELWVYAISNFPLNIVYIGACGAGESQTCRTFFHPKKICARWAKHQHGDGISLNAFTAKIYQYVIK